MVFLHFVPATQLCSRVIYLSVLLMPHLTLHHSTDLFLHGVRINSSPNEDTLFKKFQNHQSQIQNHLSIIILSSFVHNNASSLKKRISF